MVWTVPRLGSAGLPARRPLLRKPRASAGSRGFRGLALGQGGPGGGVLAELARQFLPPARRGGESRPICAQLNQVLTKIGRAHVELQSLMRISYAVFCLKQKTKQQTNKLPKPYT